MSNEELIREQRARVLSCLRHGKDLANNRFWITMKTGLSDRVVRQRIEELRNEGHLFCNLQNGKGYFIAENDEEVALQYRQDCARAMSILRRIKPFRHYLRSLDEERGDQVTFEEMALEEIISKGEL